MLVERVGGSGIIAHDIDVSHTIALAITIRISRSLAEPKVHFVRWAFQIMVNPVIPPIEIIALGGTICRRGLPLPILFDFPLAEEALQINDQPHAVSSDPQLVIIL